VALGGATERRRLLDLLLVAFPREVFARLGLAFVLDFELREERLGFLVGMGTLWVPGI
jgi:hypothetical protein